MPRFPPPPPLAVELSPEVRLACRQDPQLMASLNSIILRATRRLRTLIEAGEMHACLTGRAERLTLDVALAPPDLCRIERVAVADEEPAGFTV